MSVDEITCICAAQIDRVREMAAGSVIIAGPQCLVTRLTRPAGWSIMGRSTREDLTGDPDAPFLLDVSDPVPLQRIDTATFAQQDKVSEYG